MEYEAAVKAEAALKIDIGIMEKRFALAYMQKQLAAIPVPADTAPEKDRQAYAREKVKVDALEVDLEHQGEYRAFIRETFHV